MPNDNTRISSLAVNRVKSLFYRIAVYQALKIVLCKMGYIIFVAGKGAISS